MKHCVLISPTDSKLIEALKSRGIDVIFTVPQSGLYDNEQYHADMQCLIVDNNAYIPKVSSEISDGISKYVDQITLCSNPSMKYPDNISLNALVFGRKIFCKASALDADVSDYCNERGIEIINVNQGYTKCSTLALGDKAIITADPSVYKAATENKIDALRISSGHILLEGADYGFIGGASGVIGDKVYFFGDICKHPDFKEIADFIELKGFTFECLTDESLHDVGGFVTLQ